MALIINNDHLTCLTLQINVGLSFYGFLKFLVNICNSGRGISPFHGGSTCTGQQTHVTMTQIHTRRLSILTHNPSVRSGCCVTAFHLATATCMTHKRRINDDCSVSKYSRECELVSHSLKTGKWTGFRYVIAGNVNLFQIVYRRECELVSDCLQKGKWTGFR